MSSGITITSRRTPAPSRSSGCQLSCRCCRGAGAGPANRFRPSTPTRPCAGRSLVHAVGPGPARRSGRRPPSGAGLRERLVVREVEGGAPGRGCGPNGMNGLVTSTGEPVGDRLVELEADRPHRERDDLPVGPGTRLFGAVVAERDRDDTRALPRRSRLPWHRSASRCATRWPRPRSGAGRRRPTRRRRGRRRRGCSTPSLTRCLMPKSIGWAICVVIRIRSISGRTRAGSGGKGWSSRPRIQYDSTPSITFVADLPPSLSSRSVPLRVKPAVPSSVVGPRSLPSSQSSWDRLNSRQSFPSQNSQAIRRRSLPGVASSIARSSRQRPDRASIVGWAMYNACRASSSSSRAKGRNGCRARNAAVWSMDWSRPGQTLRTFWIAPDRNARRLLDLERDLVVAARRRRRGDAVPAGIRASGGLSSSCIPGASDRAPWTA